jgi:hypothetical protein
MSCPDARCCLHVYGAEAKKHGPYKPDSPGAAAYVFVCCNCGGYSDASGREMVRENIHFFKDEA